jgi:CzcA family heavy metal efflux pump
MSVFAFFRRHVHVVWLSTALLVVLGIASALELPSSIYPEVEFPRIVIVARTGGSPPEVFLSTVTRPLEQSLSTVLGVERIRSRTIRGATEISLQFTPETDMWRALQLVESRVAEARSGLPPDSEIITEKVTTGSFPVVTFNVSGHLDPRELRDTAEYVIRPALSQVSGVGRIEVLGGDLRELEVILDPDKAAGLHLTSADVADKLRTAMGLAAVGRVDRDRQLVTVLADAQPKGVDEIRDMPVAVGPHGSAVTLGSIAEVVEGAEDRLVRVGGPRGATVVISVARRPGASTPDVVERAVSAMKALGPSLPQGIVVEPVYDQASLVSESIASVRDAILVGIVLCALVIAVFLRDVRAGLMAGATIPITLAIVFGAMRLAGQTLNLMSLGGMAVAIGLVVDDAIVMIEAIARQRDSGASPAEAAARGATELAPAVVGTTLTTVVVFVPLAFLHGIVGDFFRALAFTLTAAVAVSLVVALVLVPLAAGIGMSSARRVEGQGRGAAYARRLAPLARRPWLAATALAAIVVLGAVLSSRVGRGFLPAMDEGAFVLDYFLPAGTSPRATEEFARGLEEELSKTPEVRTFSRRTGAELGPAAATLLSRGDIMVRLAPRRERHRSSDQIIADLRSRIGEALPEVRIEFVQVLQDVLNDLSGSPRPIEVKLFGPDYDKLHAIAGELTPELRKVEGLVDLYGGREGDAPELRFSVRRDDAARLGLTPDDVQSQLSAALLGTRVGQVRRFDRLVGVRLRYPDPIRFRPERVLDLPLAARSAVTTFAAVADTRWTASPSTLLHEGLQPLVDITADHEEVDLGRIATAIDALVARVALPQGYRIVLGGQIENERATTRQIAVVSVVALLLVFSVLAGQFRRLRLVLVVLASVPVAIVGAIVSLLATGTPLNASSLMGCVLLVGLVVKNGVLILENAEKNRDRGLAPLEAVLDASARRLRPVVMTTVATLAGLLPLAIGIGAGTELQRPLAIAVIGGLLTSTVATLGLLPALGTSALRARAAPLANNAPINAPEDTP